MRLSRLFLLSLLLLGTAALWHPARAQAGQFVDVRQAEGTTLRMFVTGPEDSTAGVLVGHDYFGISDATRQAVVGSRGYRAMAIDLYGGKSASTHEKAVALMQALDRRATDRALQEGKLRRLDSAWAARNRCL